MTQMFNAFALFSSDHLTAPRQSFLATHQRDHLEDPRDATRALLAASLRSEGGRRAATALVGLELPHPRQSRRLAKLPAVYRYAQGQGMRISTYPPRLHD